MPYDCIRDVFLAARVNHLSHETNSCENQLVRRNIGKTDIFVFFLIEAPANYNP